MGVVALGTLPLSQAVWAGEGGILKARSYADINELDPGFYQNRYNVDVMNCLYAKLISYVPGHDWKWRLEAAESIEQVDPTHIRFTLRKGLMFTGGFGEMTAEDVKYSFERIVRLDSPVKGDWSALDHVAVDPKDKCSGVIVLKEPFAPLWNITLPYGAGCIVSRKAVAALGDKNFGMKPPCYSGPYVLDAWKPNQVTVLKRNPQWTGAKPGFDEIQIFPIDDAKSAEISYESGDLDFTTAAITDFQHYKENPPQGTTLVKYPSLNYAWLGMNMDNPALKDINLRRAIQWAINVPQILQVAYDGQVEPATGLVAPGLIGHRKQGLVPPEGDLDKAKDYLSKADSSNPSLRLYVWSDATWTTMAQVVQAQLGQIGIKVTLEVLDSGSWSTLGMENKGSQWQQIQLMLNRFTMQPDPYYATEWFTCDQVGVWNWERFCSKKFDRLNQAAIKETDTKKRAAIYVRMQDIMERSGAYRFITHEATPVMYRSSKFAAAMRPDGAPLYRLFESKS